MSTQQMSHGGVRRLTTETKSFLKTAHAPGGAVPAPPPSGPPAA
jgi:hypothetical protein